MFANVGTTKNLKDLKDLLASHFNGSARCSHMMEVHNLKNPN